MPVSQCVSSRMARCAGLRVWAEPFTKLRLQKIFNLFQDPYERADVTPNTYRDCSPQQDEVAHRPRAIVPDRLGHTPERSGADSC